MVKLIAHGCVYGRLDREYVECKGILYSKNLPYKIQLKNAVTGRAYTWYQSRPHSMIIPIKGGFLLYRDHPMNTNGVDQMITYKIWERE